MYKKVYTWKFDKKKTTSKGTVDSTLHAVKMKYKQKDNEC
jgi:hypothetical protein